MGINGIDVVDQIKWTFLLKIWFFGPFWSREPPPLSEQISKYAPLEIPSLFQKNMKFELVK